MEIYYTCFFRQKSGGHEHSRQLLNRVLRHYCGLPEAAEILTERKGRHYVDKSYGLCFSVTHTGNLWCCCVSDHPVGIDAEFWTRQVTNPGKLAGRFLTAEEQKYFFAGNDNEDQRNRLLYLWTRKEAYLKYTGEGLYGLSRAPSVVNAPGSTWISSFNRDGVCVSVCAEKTDCLENPRWVCLDGNGAENESGKQK